MSTTNSTEDPLVVKFRNELLARGVSGIKNFGQFFRRSDREDPSNPSLTLKEFVEGVRAYNLKLTEIEIKHVFDQFDHDKTGTIDFDEFLEAVRPPLSEKRMNLIKMAFQKLDRTNDGKVTIQDVKGVYNVKHDQKYLNGEMTEEQILAKFLKSFESDGQVDGTVTYEEFVHYYSGVSASIDSDPYFDIMMRQVWKL